MKKSFKKAVTWLMVFCTVISILPVFGSAAAIEEKPVPALVQNVGKTVLFSAQPEGELGEISPDNPIDFLSGFFKAIIKNLQSLSVDELLNLPANAMDDLITYVFAVFKILGINLDALYQKISSFFIAA